MNIIALKTLSEAVAHEREIQVDIGSGKRPLHDLNYQNVASHLIQRHSKKFNSDHWLRLTCAIVEIISEVENE